MHPSLLPTKLHRSRTPSQQVLRPHLLARLDQGLMAGHHLIVVVAPAGFGKSTIISQWLDPNVDWRGRNAEFEGATPTPRTSTGWLSLDESDNDLSLFLHYLVAAVRQTFPTACSATLSLLQTPQLPPTSYLANTLLHDLSALDQSLILVLDDYHCIRTEAIHHLLSCLLVKMPELLHLVLLSRTEPPLPLARLRVRQQLTELRAADLCFLMDETQVLLTQTLGRALSAETIATLQTQTEGWVAGLQLAALALSGCTDETAFAQRFAVRNQHVMDYLLQEVLASQPQAVQTFLARTSILECFCAPLCEAILTADSEEEGASTLLLPYLIQSHLFLVPLDDQGEWYRYHHLFRELLRQHLHAHTSAVEIAALHRRASVWLADHGWIEKAIQHALAGQDEQTAAHLVAQRYHEMLNHEDWRTLERWLALLPEPLVQQHAALLIAKALVLNVQFKLAAIPPLLQAAAGALRARLHDHVVGEVDIQVLQGEIDGLWSQQWYWQQEGQRSLAAAQQALEHLPADRLYTRSGALLYLGLAAQMTGQLAVGQQTLRTALAAQQAYPSTFVTRVLYAMASIHYLAGELTLMHQVAADCLQAATRANLPLGRGWAHYWLGVVHYEWNELDAAAHHFGAAVELRYSVNVLVAHNSWLGLAWIEQVQGRPDQAQQQVDALLQFHHEQNGLAFLAAVHAFQARLALQQGKRATAARWAGAANLAPLRGPLVEFELPLLTRAKICLAQGAVSSLAAALADLTQLSQVAEFTHNTIRLIEILAVQALVEAAQGQIGPVLATLQRAVLLAKPGRCIRTFVDLGPTMAGLLYQLVKRKIEVEYLGEVLAAFPPGKATAGPAKQTSHPAPVNLIEPLTERESEVLAYLQKGLPNKVIAQALKISALTVKRHLTNLYQKLGVKGRKQAVARSQALGILPTRPTNSYFSLHAENSPLPVGGVTVGHASPTSSA